MCPGQSRGGGEGGSAVSTVVLSWSCRCDIPRAEIIYVDPELVLLPPEDHKAVPVYTVHYHSSKHPFLGFFPADRPGLPAQRRNRR